MLSNSLVSPIPILLYYNYVYFLLYLGPYQGKKVEKKHLKNKTINSVVDESGEHDNSATESARIAVQNAVKKAATAKRLKMLEEQ